MLFGTRKKVRIQPTIAQFCANADLCHCDCGGSHFFVQFNNTTRHDRGSSPHIVSNSRVAATAMSIGTQIKVRIQRNIAQVGVNVNLCHGDHGGSHFFV